MTLMPDLFISEWMMITDLDIIALISQLLIIYNLSI